MKSRPVALCGMLCALAVVILALGGMMGIATYCAPLLAMAALLPVLEELGPRLALCAWAAVSILALLLVPDRETALVYLFFGWYPVLRPHLQRIPSRGVRLAVKLALGSGLILMLYGLVLRLMGLTADLLEGTTLLNFALFVMGNVVFLLLDLVLQRLTALWRVRWRRFFFK